MLDNVSEETDARKKNMLHKSRYVLNVREDYPGSFTLEKNRLVKKDHTASSNPQ